MEGLSGGQVTRDKFIRIAQQKNPTTWAGFKYSEEIGVYCWLAA
jgi:hypothetical protein